MQNIEAVVLGIIQGLTEFLPVSSSGHLVLFQNLFGFNEPELLFDISVHVGTLIAICVIFFNEIISILTTLVRLPKLMQSSGGFKKLLAENEDARIAMLIIIGSVPTGILGILFHKAAHQIFGSIWIVGLMLLITGTLLWLTRNIDGKGRIVKNVSIKDALIIGLVQGMAILPGISRSGSTIATGLFLGIDRELAARYSFLLSIPAILGALVLGLDSSIMQTSIPIFTILLGSGTAAIVGCLALIILLKVVKKGGLHFFAPYCWTLGIAALIWSSLG